MSDIIANPNTTEPGSLLFTEAVPDVRHILKSQNQQARQDGQELLSTLFIFHRCDAHQGFERLMASRSNNAQSVIVRLNRFHEDRANARSLAYMREAIISRIGSLGLRPTNEVCALHQLSLSEFEQIVLLWPDANGLGWFNIERQVFKKKKARTPVYVLNGRRRLFELPRSLWRRYRLRRFLEKSFLLEIGVVFVFFVTAPVLTLWDMVFEPAGRHK